MTEHIISTHLACRRRRLAGMLPVLSADGTLSFPDTESLLSTCEHLRRCAPFEVEVQGGLMTGLVRLRIRLPDSSIPLVHTAALRQGGPGRALVGMSGAAAVIERLERAVDAARSGGTSDRPRSGATGPHPAAPPRQEPRRPTAQRVVVSLADMDPAPPLPPDPAPPQRIPAAAPVVAAPPATPRPATPPPPVAARPSPDSTRQRPDASAAAAPSPSPRLELKGTLVRQPQVHDLRGLFSETIDRLSLGATNLSDLLRYLFMARATGRLRLVGKRTKTFWLVEGDLGPSEAEPARPEELLGHLLVKMGKLTSSAPVDEAIAIARRNQRRTGEVLVEKGLLDPAQLAHLLRAQTEMRLIEACEWSSAEYEFESAPAPAGAPLLGALRAHVALARHVAARATPQDVQARFVMIQARYARLAPLADVEEIALLGDARSGHTLRHAFPGTHRLKDALSSCPLGRLPTMRLLVLCEAYGVLEMDASPLVLAHGADPAGALRHRVFQAKEHDPFRRLGAHAAMHVDQIREAYSRVMNDCGPGGPWDRIDTEAAASMVTLAEEAFRTLYDLASRARCRRDSLGPGRSRFVAELLCAHALALRASSRPQHLRAVAEVAIELADSSEARDLLASA